MKKLLKISLSFFAVCLFTFAFVTPLNMPPGWFQQVLPVSDQINDIFFLDTSIGWVVTQGRTTGSDTGYIMKTTNGGNNWVIQHREILNFNVVQFLDANTGYAGGGDGFPRMLKTTNGGVNWSNTNPIGNVRVRDLHFINKDTGWACDEALIGGGLFRTTNGSISWQQQLNQTYLIQKIFILNKDTGWAGSSDSKLYRTTNSGINWTLQYNSGIEVRTIFFINGLNGWINGSTGNGILYTTNGGFNWITAQGENGGFDIKFVTDSIGFAGGGNQPLRIIKSTDGGKTWGYQSAQVTPDISVATLKNDTLRVWAGRQLLVHTTDGGGAITYSGIQQIGNEVPKEYSLEQNYPNPFNPETNIRYRIRTLSEVKLIVYDITGKEIAMLVNQKHSAGLYKVDWDASGYTSGIYFYTLIIEGKIIATRKMALVK